jgi:radical SAM superfamily enzyme YgiQ (UPF0313 family)
MFFLEPLLNKFFTRNLKDRYYSEFLPRDSDGIFPQLPYSNNTNSSFYFCERLISSEKLWRYLADKDENPFYQFYLECGIISILEKEDIDLLGLSVISPSQVIASLTLGFLVKKRLPHIHVTIGGQWPTLYRDAILKKKELFKCFDSVIVFDGESSLYELTKRLEAGQSISSIPNLLVCDSVPGASLTRVEEDMDKMPCPDFDGLALKNYDGSQDGRISLTYETSRGCYWSKCAYCVDLPLPKPAYRTKNAALVVNDMKELKRRYNAGYLLFGDPGLSPRQMREISMKIIEGRVEMEWWTMARLDPGFDRPLFELAYAAGLRQINFGFESASDRICELLDKGNKRARSSRIIRECSEAGIKVDLQTMVGLPGESFEDAMETIDFLVSHKEFITHVTFNTYYLTPSNSVYMNPAKYGIEYENAPQLPFRFFIPFKNKNGMGMDWASQMEKIYYSLINNDSDNDPSIASRLSGKMSEGYVELALIGESCRMRYQYDAGTDSCTFIDDEDTEAQKQEPAFNAT